MLEARLKAMQGHLKLLNLYCPFLSSVQDPHRFDQDRNDHQRSHKANKRMQVLEEQRQGNTTSKENADNDQRNNKDPATLRFFFPFEEHVV